MNERLKKLFEKDKRTSNLVLIVILLVLVLIASNYIFTDEADAGKYSQVISENVKETLNGNGGLEEKLANIISKIDGIETVHVMVTYSNTEKIIPVYDTKEDINTTNDGTKKTTEKTVAYESEGSSKVAIVESKQAAIATGAIIVAKGNVTEGVKSEIKSAVSMVTDVPLYKVQIFINE